MSMVAVETKDVDLSKRVQFDLSQGVENKSTSTDLGRWCTDNATCILTRFWEGKEFFSWPFGPAI